MSSLTTFAMQIAVAVPESLLARTFKGELTEAEKSDLDEQQLWREKELGDTDSSSRKASIQRVIAPIVQEYFKMASKSSQLSHEEKMELNKLRIKIGGK